MKRVIRAALISAAVLVVVVVAVRVGFAPRPIAVQVARVSRGTVEDLVANSEAGTVRARRVAKLSAERTGRIVLLPHDEGDWAPARGLVAQIDPSSADSALHAARHDVEAMDAARVSARAAERAARDAFERARSLHAQKLIPDQQYEDARARYDQAAAELRAAEARRAAADAGVGVRVDEAAHLAVRMPFAGIVTRRFVERGESVVPGQPVVEVMTLDSLYVRAPLDERDAARVRPGQPARVTLDPYPGTTWRGPVTRVAPVVEETLEQNRTLAVEVDLSRDPRLPQPRPGMSADVEIVLARRDSVLRVPSAAVIDGRRVYVVENGRARTRAVTIGMRNWDWTEITSGLAGGDAVITSLDKPGLGNGSRVREAPVTPAAGAR